MTEQKPRLRRECHYDGRVVTCYADRPASIDALFRRTVAAHPDRIAVVSAEQRMTYRNLERMVECVAGNERETAGGGFIRLHRYFAEMPDARKASRTTL